MDQDTINRDIFNRLSSIEVTGRISDEAVALEKKSQEVMQAQIIEKGLGIKADEILMIKDILVKAGIPKDLVDNSVAAKAASIQPRGLHN